MKKLLVALDCSPLSMRAASYAAEIVPHLPDAQVILFTVLTGVPSSEKKPDDTVKLETRQSQGDEDHLQEQNEVEKVLTQAAQMFAEQQLPAERLTVLAKPLRRGIAQDIADEARAFGCDTVVVGRRGLSKMKQMVLGSVSRDLIQKSEGLAVWVID
jgi:nucleotide-binding universal stress UspA family protein